MLTKQDIDALSGSLLAFLEAREGARRFHAKAIGRGVNPEYCLADFLHRIARQDHAGILRIYGEATVAHTKAAMGESSGVIGGYLVPPALATSLYETIDEESIVRPYATVVSMPSLSLMLPLPDTVTPQSAGIPAMFGGFYLSWTQEAAARDEEEPRWRQVELKAWELSGVCYASNNFLADAADGTEAFLRRLFARSVAWAEDFAFLQGDGVGKPTGTKNAACALPVNRASATDFKFADAAGMVEKLLPSSWPFAFWVMHPLALAKLVALATTTTATWQANQERVPGVSGPVGSLHSMPVYVTERVPKLGTAGDVQLIDPRLYVIGDRGEIEIALSAEEPTAFLRNQSVFRIVRRVDGQPWLGGPVTLTDSTTTVSPFVYLN